MKLRWTVINSESEFCLWWQCVLFRPGMSCDPSGVTECKISMFILPFCVGVLFPIYLWQFFLFYSFVFALSDSMYACWSHLLSLALLTTLVPLIVIRCQCLCTLNCIFVELKCGSWTLCISDHSRGVSMHCGSRK